MLIKRDWAVVRGMILLGMIALVIAIPYFVNLYYATQEPLYERAVAMQGFVKTHAPVFGSLVLVMLAGFLLLFKRADLKRYWYMLALVVTPLAVLNQQVITGTYFYSDHYHWYYHKPLFVIIFTIIVFELIFRIFKDKKTQKAIALFAFIVIMLVNLCSAYRIQKDSYMYWEGITRGNQRYGPLMDWFNANAKLDEVVMGDESVSMYIPMFTSLNGLNTEDGHYFLSSDEQQVLERTFISYRLNGVTKESARDYFYTKRGYISGQIYGQMYRKLYGDYDKIPDEKLDFVIAKYIEFLNQPLEHYLKKYNMDYLVKDESGSPGWRHEIDKIESLELIAEVESFDIYKFK